MNTSGFSNGTILVPNVADMTSWSVIASDQFTSQPQYWQEVAQLVQTRPSTLNLIIPECGSVTDDMDQRIASVGRAMRTYLRRHLFCEHNDYIYTQRTLQNGKVRRGLVGLVDLECFDPRPGSRSPIRSTEHVIPSTMEIRTQIRATAPLEVSHIQLLIDDPQGLVIEPLADEAGQMTPLYDFDLMKDSGHITGSLVTPEQSARIDRALQALGDRQRLLDQYGEAGENGFVFAIGDGNNSLCTAKLHWENLKQSLSAEKLKNHPARYALAEVINLHDPALEFGPINRILFGVDVPQFLRQMEKECDLSYTPCEGQTFEYVVGGQVRRAWVRRPSSNVVTGTVQNFIDEYIQNFSGKVDYVHGNGIVCQLSMQKDNIGFLFPSIRKEELFPTVLLDGRLPRKTFSMGVAEDKRFYLECRRITK